MANEKREIAVGKMISSESESHRGYGAGSGSVDTTVFECPCGKGTFVDVYDAIPGFREHDYRLNCSDCLKKYDFNPNTGKITDK